MSPGVESGADLAARAAFLARLHRSESLDEWLTHVIREPVEFEEAAFVDAKQELVTKGSQVIAPERDPGCRRIRGYIVTSLHRDFQSCVQGEPR